MNQYNLMNNKAKFKIQAIEESFFDPDVYFKKEEFKQAIDFLEKEKQKEMETIKNSITKINSKKFIEKFKEEYGTEYPLIIIETYTDLKRFIKMVGITGDAKKDMLLSYFFATEFTVKFNTGEEGKVFIISIPKATFIKRIKEDYLNSIFSHPLWKELEYQIISYHEMVETSENLRILTNKNANRNGSIYVKHQGKLYIVGQHNSTLVLAKEAVVLNKFKHLKAFKKLKNIRQIEYLAIKEATGVDLNTIKEITPEIQKKLNKYNFIDKDGNTAISIKIGKFAEKINNQIKDIEINSHKQSDSIDGINSIIAKVTKQVKENYEMSKITKEVAIETDLKAKEVLKKVDEKEFEGKELL